VILLLMPLKISAAGFAPVKTSPKREKLRLTSARHAQVVSIKITFLLAISLCLPHSRHRFRHAAPQPLQLIPQKWVRMFRLVALVSRVQVLPSICSKR
jgi:hypothetical protein